MIAESVFPEESAALLRQGQTVADHVVLGSPKRNLPLAGLRLQPFQNVIVEYNHAIARFQFAPP